MIGGLDPCGGAGITADTRVLHMHRCTPAAVTSCLTVQNRHGLAHLEPIACDLLVAMTRAVFDDGAVDAVKVGLCGAAGVVDALAEVLAGYPGPVVVDPVLMITAGGWAATGELVQSYRAFARRVAAIWTPNAIESRTLAPTAGSAELLSLGALAVVEKGGHAEGASTGPVVDSLVTAMGRVSFRHRRAISGEVHGTGCALASSLAAGLAHGREPGPALRMASRWVSACLHAMGAPAPGAGPSKPRAFDPTAARARVRTAS